MLESKRHINKEILIKIVNSLGLDFPLKEIAEKMKIDKGNLSSYLSGNKPVSTNFIQKLCDHYDLDLNNYNIITTDIQPIVQATIIKQGVPFYDVDFTSSFLEITNNQSIQPDSYISHPFFNGCDYVVRNSGQSMAKVINHGDAIGLVKLNNWQDFFPFGEIYAIVTNDNLRMIKVITKGETDEHLTLISKPTDSKRNEFPPQQIKKSSILSIFKVQASSHLF